MARDDVRVVRRTDGGGDSGGPNERPDPTAGHGWAGAVPNLEARTVVGVFSREADLQAAYRALMAEGYDDASVSIVRQHDSPAPPMGAEATKAGAGAAAGAATGAVLGGLAGLAALAIPGIGPLLVAGPIASVLTGVVAGGALGGLAGSFAGLGMPTEHAERYAEAVRAGGTFVAVKTADDKAAERAMRLFKDHGATETTSYNPGL